MALYRLLANQPSGVDEEMTQIICAACKQVIGAVDSDEYLQEIAEQIAHIHTPECPATPEEREQAIYDMKFRDMTNNIGL